LDPPTESLLEALLDAPLRVDARALPIRLEGDGVVPHVLPTLRGFNVDSPVAVVQLHPILEELVDHCIANSDISPEAILSPHDHGFDLAFHDLLHEQGQSGAVGDGSDRVVLQARAASARPPFVAAVSWFFFEDVSFPQREVVLLGDFENTFDLVTDALGGIFIRSGFPRVPPYHPWEDECLGLTRGEETRR
jgi:hypothetical protein